MHAQGRTEMKMSLYEPVALVDFIDCPKPMVCVLKGQSPRETHKAERPDRVSGRAMSIHDRSAKYFITPATPTLLVHQKDLPGGPVLFLRQQEVLVQLQPPPATITASACFTVCHHHFRAAILSTRVAARYSDFRAAIFTAQVPQRESRVQEVLAARGVKASGS